MPNRSLQPAPSPRHARATPAPPSCSLRGYLLDPLQAMAYHAAPDARPPAGPAPADGAGVAPAGPAGCGLTGRPREEGSARAGLGVDVADADASAVAGTGYPGAAFLGVLRNGRAPDASRTRPEPFLPGSKGVANLLLGMTGLRTIPAAGGRQIEKAATAVQQKLRQHGTMPDEGERRGRETDARPTRVRCNMLFMFVQRGARPTRDRRETDASPL
eukprot:gene14304-biopygen18627